jgi:hypothetical protein
MELSHAATRGSVSSDGDRAASPLPEAEGAAQVRGAPTQITLVGTPSAAHDGDGPVFSSPARPTSVTHASLNVNVMSLLDTRCLNLGLLSWL